MWIKGGHRFQVQLCVARDPAYCPPIESRAARKFELIADAGHIPERGPNPLEELCGLRSLASGELSRRPGS